MRTDLTRILVNLYPSWLMLTMTCNNHNNNNHDLEPRNEVVRETLSLSFMKFVFHAYVTKVEMLVMRF